MTVEADSNIFLTAFHSESHLPASGGWAGRSDLQLVALLSSLPTGWTAFSIVSQMAQGPGLPLRPRGGQGPG